ncbi:YceI family protein [SAR92 clade bacterium H455]|uniref:YceI family protein n=1 Tax=SAR92 clade bacterium H455 TaxID=2974818 RepID=A0ABY5TP28_9GAMM|nr:YceI family protein [SAR92 clade bacterium H455]
MNYFVKAILLSPLLFCQSSLADQWQSVLTNSKLNYEVTFQGLPIDGRFTQFSVDYSPAEKLLVKVAVDSADMSDDELNREIAGVDWFDVGRFDQAVFSSNHLITNSFVAESNSKERFIAEGSLNLKGVSEPVNVPFTWQPDAQNPDRATMSGELVLKRSDFSIGIGDWSSGDQIGIDVRVSFVVEMQRQAQELNN